VLSFNILEAGGDAPQVGFPASAFGGDRTRHIAAVIRQTGAAVVAIQEDTSSGALLAALGEGWFRQGNIYSKHSLTLLKRQGLLTVCRVALRPDASVIVANVHWHGRGGGSFEVQRRIKEGPPPPGFEGEILKSVDQTEGPRGYRETLDAVRPFLRAGESVIVAGDFNEASHLDWTARYAATGADRWVKNSTGIPLRFAIAWQGSRLLAELGFKDAYRSAYPDEVAKPGNTWTPPYPDGSPGRRPYADQVLDRIDRIYFWGTRIGLLSAAVVGESTESAEIVYSGPWPSDHRAVLAVFDLRK
jgi:endonuclease/exonuclease/phosphatase family metal-dependent hydrolase